MKLFFAVALLTAAVVSAASAATTIKINYTLVYDRIRPEPQRNVRATANFQINLSESGAVSEGLTRTAGRLSDNFKRGMKLGNGWQVAGENQLRRVINQPQSTLVLTVTTSGSSCSLDVNFKLKPGFTEYKLRRITDGSMAFFTEPQIQSKSCSIR